MYRLFGRRYLSKIYKLVAENAIELQNINLAAEGNLTPHRLELETAKRWHREEIEKTNKLNDLNQELKNEITRLTHQITNSTSSKSVAVENSPTSKFDLALQTLKNANLSDEFAKIADLILDKDVVLLEQIKSRKVGNRLVAFGLISKTDWGSSTKLELTDEGHFVYEAIVGTMS